MARGEHIALQSTAINQTILFSSFVGCAVLWAMLTHAWIDAIAFAITLAGARLARFFTSHLELTHINNTLQDSCLMWLWTALLVTHPFNFTFVAPFVLMWSLYKLISPTTDADHPIHIIYGLSLYGLCTMVMPSWLWLTPIMAFATFYLHAYTKPHLSAAIIGFVLPFWFRTGYALLFADATFCLQPFVDAFHVNFIWEESFTSVPFLTWVTCLFLAIAIAMGYGRNIRACRTRIRLSSNLIIIVMFALLILTALQAEQWRTSLAAAMGLGSLLAPRGLLQQRNILFILFLTAMTVAILLLNLLWMN